MRISIRNVTRIITIVILLLFTVVPSSAGETSGKKVSDPSVVSGNDGRHSKSGYESDGGFGGPTSVQGELEEEDRINQPAFRFPAIDAALQPWFDYKKDLKDRYGLQFGVHYTTTFQGASDELTGAEDFAASGIFRVLGAWTLVNRDGPNKGTLDFSVDHRHRLGTDIAPSELGFDAGYLGIPAVLFSDIGWALVDLNWQQYLNDGRTGVIVGRYDPNDYLDVLGYGNPWTAFQNLAILFNTSIALPDASIGFGAGHWFTDQWYGLATINDANGVVSEIDFFEGGAEFYSSAEVGWTLSRKDRYTHNVHFTGWHADNRDDAGVPESWGFTTGMNWTFDNTWMPFFRAGWSDGEAPLMNATATLGVLHYRADRSDLIGFAVNWGNPADDALEDQYTGELFYRLQLSQNLAITPHVQLLIDPALNPDEDHLWIGGIRIRLTL